MVGTVMAGLKHIKTELATLLDVLEVALSPADALAAFRTASSSQ